MESKEQASKHTKLATHDELITNHPVRASGVKKNIETQKVNQKLKQN